MLELDIKVVFVLIKLILRFRMNIPETNKEYILPIREIV